MLPRRLHPAPCNPRPSALSLTKHVAPLVDQGQGGGQAIEDAEALGALLRAGTPAAHVPALLKKVQEIRYERATRIQAYSREKALGPKEGAVMVNAQEHAQYNFRFSGALAWAKEHGIETKVAA